MEHVGRMMHNSHDTYYRNPFGAVASNTQITIRFSTNTRLIEIGDMPEEIILRLWIENEGEGKNEILHKMRFMHQDPCGLCWYEASFTAPAEPKLIWYYFIINQKGKTFYYGNNHKEQGGVGVLSDYLPSSYQISVYRPESATPDWLKNAVIYQIFPDRFYNGQPDGSILNPREKILVHTSWDDTPVYTRDMDTWAILAYDFFGGNLLGVIKKLPYLKELGVNTIYFNPIFDSVSNHKYDTADYKNIDRMFGDNALFEELCAKAKEMGISVILDGVFSHTGSDSIYFNQFGKYPTVGACQSKDSPYYPWYRFMSYPDVYESWWGIDTMPNVEESEPSYLNYIIEEPDSVVKHWNKLGSMGWRLDVADELPSIFLKKLRKTLKAENPDAIIIGEVWEDASRKVAYGELRQYFDGDHLDSVMNYPFRKALIDFLMGYQNAEVIDNILLSLYENYPKENFYANMNIIGTHDVPRILTILGGAPPESEQSKMNVYSYKMPPADKELAIARLKLAVMWQMTFPGAPCVYYGDEAGMEGYSDPYNRGTYPWGRENKEISEWYKKLIALRNNHPVLRTGEWISVVAEGDLYGYIRQIKGGQDVFGKLLPDNVAIVIMNRSQANTNHLSINITEWIDDQEYVIDVLNDNKKIPLDEDGTLHLEISPLEGKVLLKSLDALGKPGERKSGVLLHPTSLPGAYGIGDLGNEAYKFTNFLRESGQKFWQVLPLNPPSYGESPYQCLSAFAGNPFLISPEKLVEAGYLSSEDLNSAKDTALSDKHVNFAAVYAWKNNLFEKAFHVFKQQPLPKDYADFVSHQSFWLDDYVLFMALRKHFNEASWTEWDATIKKREPKALSTWCEKLAERIEFHTFLQYIFNSQWKSLKTYANNLGVKIIGDMPLFVAHDSADVWANPNLFGLKKNGAPTHVAGVPPDYFSSTGQLWGNPLYRWEDMAKDDYMWWRQRLKAILALTDIVRIDHFRGFEAYWEIPAGEKTAVNGRWVKGPGFDFFEKMKKHMGDIPLIAEDLGVITPPVKRLKNRFKLPGMKILQFCLGNGYDEAPEFPHNCGTNVIAYTGTHDNDTLLDWWQTTVKDDTRLSAIVRNHLKRLGMDCTDKTDDKEICQMLIQLIYNSQADTVILPLQDILFLGAEARMNVPGTLDEKNWAWRYSADALNPSIIQRLKNWTLESGRA